MRITIKDLARASGVSPSTVSYVLNNGPKPVHEKTREHVLEVMRELDYHPSAIARAMSSKRMNTLCLVSGVWATPVINFYFAGLLQGVLAVAQSRGQSATIFPERNWPEVVRNFPILCDGRCDGLILTGVPAQENDFAVLQHRHMPFVCINSNITDPKTTCVDIDDLAAAYSMVTYLIEQGHRRIAILCGHDAVPCTGLRLQGYRQALRDAAIDPEEPLILPGRYSEQSGYDSTLKLMLDPDIEAPTALFCMQDGIAFGALRALTALKLRVPHNISVAGFDDIYPAQASQPPLTTVRQPLTQLGERASLMLLAEIHDGVAPGRKEVLPTVLAIRETVSPPYGARSPAVSHMIARRRPRRHQSTR